MENYHPADPRPSLISIFDHCNATELSCRCTYLSTWRMMSAALAQFCSSSRCQAQWAMCLLVVSGIITSDDLSHVWSLRNFPSPKPMSKSDWQLFCTSITTGQCQIWSFQQWKPWRKKHHGRVNIICENCPSQASMQSMHWLRPTLGPGRTANPSRSTCLST